MCLCLLGRNWPIWNKLLSCIKVLFCGYDSKLPLKLLVYCLISGAILIIYIEVMLFTDLGSSVVLWWSEAIRRIYRGAIYVISESVLRTFQHLGFHLARNDRGLRVVPGELISYLDMTTAWRMKCLFALTSKTVNDTVLCNVGWRAVQECSSSYFVSSLHATDSRLACSLTGWTPELHTLSSCLISIKCCLIAACLAETFF